MGTLFVALESGVIEALGLQRWEEFLSEGRRHKVASKIILLRVGNNGLYIVERRLSRWPALVVAK